MVTCDLVSLYSFFIFSYSFSTSTASFFLLSLVHTSPFHFPYDKKPHPNFLRRRSAAYTSALPERCRTGESNLGESFQGFRSHSDCVCRMACLGSQSRSEPSGRLAAVPISYCPPSQVAVLQAL